MEPALLDLYAKRGDSFSKPIRVKLKSTGEYVDFTGKTVTAQVRAQADDLTPIATLTVTVHDQDLTPGAVTLSLAPATTSTLTPGYYRWDLQASGGPTDVTTFVQGRYELSADITR